MMNNVKIFAKTIESTAREQIEQLAAYFPDSKIRIMPDVHTGAGCTIGFTANLGDKVIPAVVGVDIGCGMLVQELGNIDIDFTKLDTVIRQFIPVGQACRASIPDSKYLIDLRELYCFDKLKNLDRLYKSVGTLGGGNHFIEVNEYYGDKYLVVHTGSRNLGKQVCDIYQAKAVDYIKRNRISIEDTIAMLKEQGREQEIESQLKSLKASNPMIPKELCYLEGRDREDYLHDMRLCQEYATMNRKCIIDMIVESYGFDLKPEYERFETIHNYINFNDNIIRKGAISCRKGERVIIPINMRDGSILGYGKGYEDWNYSGPHGAGRLMSRSQARSSITMCDYEDSMKGIYSSTVTSQTIDEAPQAYKPIDEIVECIRPNVTIEKIIKPIYNFKAFE